MSRQRVAIAGAGCSGAALAIWLARAGHEVVLVDDGRQQRIGESLVPACAPLLADLGIDTSGFVPKPGALFTLGERAVRFDFSEALRPEWPIAWQCKREDLDGLLRRAARDAGVTLVRGTVTSFDTGARPALLLGDERIEADRVVDATGQSARLARQLGLRQPHPALRNSARAAWFRGVEWVGPEVYGDVVISAFEGGWFWLAPLGDDLATVGMVSTPAGPRGDWDEALRRCPAAAQRLAHAEPVEPLRGAADFTATASRFHGEGWALVGDAATFLDPVFSTGVALGLYGARWLAEAIDGQRTLADYEARVRDAIKVFEPVVHAFYDGSFFTVASAPEASAFQGVRAAVVSLLAGDVFDPDFRPPRRVSRRIGPLGQRLAQR